MLWEGPQVFKVSSTAPPGWPNIWIALATPIPTYDGPVSLSFYVVLGRPKSRGSIGLNAEKYKAGVKDDVQLAVLDFALLTHPDDMDDMVEGENTKHNRTFL